MEEVALELVDALVVGELPCVEVSEGVDQNVQLVFIDLGPSEQQLRQRTNDSYLRSVQILQRQSPLRLVWHPFGLLHFLLQPQILVHIVFSRDPLPVIPDLGALGKLLRPLGVRLKARLVRMCRHIAPDAGVGIFEPVQLASSASASRTLPTSLPSASLQTVLAMVNPNGSCV